MPVESIDLVWIMVKDFKKAVKFYTEVVGLQLMEIHEECEWAELQGKTGARLGIGKCQESSPIDAGQNGVITFTVKNLDQVKADMVKKGAVCIGDIKEVPGHVRMQLIRDLDGNHLQLAQML